MSITLLIIVVTGFISITSFGNQNMMQQLVFSPYAIKRKKEWFRFITSGFLHVNWMHLILNMYVLFLFGTVTEAYFSYHFDAAGVTLYVVMYLLAIILSEVYSYVRHRDNPSYASLGASGAVSAVVFASILFLPDHDIHFIFLPREWGIPGYVFGILYLTYSMYMAKNANDNIGHYAHFFGALFGFVFPLFLKPSLITEFIQQISHAN